MAGVKISQLPWNAPLTGTEIVPVVQGINNVKMLVADLVGVQQIDGGAPDTVYTNVSQLIDAGGP